MENPNKNSNLTNLDDIIFENRNKTYGAYFLRKNYSKYLTKAVIYGLGACLLLIGGAWGYQKFVVPNLSQDEITSLDVNLEDLVEEEEEEEIIEIPEEEEPEPEPPEEINQIQFLPPEPKADEEVKIELPPPTIEEAKDAVISKETVEGKIEVGLVPPPPPPPPKAPSGLGKATEEKIFTAVEQQPEFPGGTAEMYKYIGSNMKYPAAAQRANVSGRVFVKFVVEREANRQSGLGFRWGLGLVGLGTIRYGARGSSRTLNPKLKSTGHNPKP